MQKYLLLTLFLISSIFSPITYAVEGYIGENPGFNFYSKIDEGSYTVQKRLVSLELQKTPDFSTFAQGCKDAKLLSGIRTDEKILTDISAQNYARLSNLLKGKNVTTDQFQNLTSCLSEKYKTIQTDTKKEQDARETVSSIGLYADGDKTNSDYDIITDIEKINEIIFSTDLKYAGTRNVAAKSLLDLLSGNKPTTNFAPNPALTPVTSTLPVNNGGTVVAGGTNTPPATQNNPTTPATPATPATLATLVGEVCTDPNAIGPIDMTSDSAFLGELESVINGSNSTQVAAGFSASDTPTPTTITVGGVPVPSPAPTISPTSTNDFFHKNTCPPGSMFCIDVKMIPGGAIKLAGGKNVSIEGIVDKFAAHLLPISESSLAYQRMTNNQGSLPTKDLQLWKSIGGLRIYLGNKPQQTRRDKSEQSPDREMTELKAIVDCGYITAGLPTNLAKANSLAGSAFAGRGNSTDIKLRDVRPIGVQEGIEMAKLSGCMNEYMQEGRQTYYNSLSTDLTEIQAFTAGMIAEIRDIMNITAPMKDKPVK